MLVSNSVSFLTHSIDRYMWFIQRSVKRSSGESVDNKLRTKLLYAKFFSSFVVTSVSLRRDSAKGFVCSVAKLIFCG